MQLAPSAPISRDAKLIYLVDDENLLLEAAAAALQRDGYELKAFQDPAAAFESFAKEAAKPSLLLTDYAMESMTGIELSEKCKAVHPELKILMVSGTAGPEIVRECHVPVDQFIAKPYQPSQLSDTVRSLLRD